MPTGTGAVNLRNLPNVAYEVNPAKFFALTEKNVFEPLSNLAIAAPANYITNQLLQVGVVSQLRLLVKGVVQVITTATAGGSTITPTFKWPYGIFSAILLSGNGMNNFINARGTDLFARQQSQNRAYVDQYTLPGIGPNGVQQNPSLTVNYPFQTQIVVPIAMDDATLIGSLYAQSEATNLTLTLTTEAVANLFTSGTPGNVTSTLLLNTAGGAGTVPNVTIMETFFEVPYAPDKADTLVIPDLTVLHGILANDNPVAGLGLVTTPLYRINGQLERLFFYEDNNNALVTIGSANWLQAYLQYGGNQTPYTYNPLDFLRIKNNEDYRFALYDGIFCIDLVAENPARDQVLLEGVTNLRLVTQTVNTFTPNAAAKIHFVQETLFA